MRAIASLVYAYFTCTRLACVFSGAGIVMCLISAWVLTHGSQSEPFLAFAYAGQLAFFLGSSNMPLLAGRLSQGQAARLLPHGRVKLLLSMMLTVAIVVLPVGILAPFAMNGASAQVSRLATDSALRSFVIDMGLLLYTSSCILACWLYLAMWFVTSQRNSAGFSKALVVIVVLVMAPTRELQNLDADVRRNVVQLLVAWLVFGAIFLAWPKLKNRGPRSWIPGLRLRATQARSAGREFDLMLGTNNPWVYIGALLVPVFLATRIGRMSPAVWLYMLTIFSTVTGAIAGQAAERSRVLWLRGEWSRAELFRRVEASFVRHNSFVLGVLLALMVGIGSYEGQSVTILAAGIPLLILGTASSTYLGLIVTRGVRWPEALLAIALMLVLMALPLLLDARVPNLNAVIALEVALASSVVVLRQVARRRWTTLDWMECRRARLAIARTS